MLCQDAAGDPIDRHVDRTRSSVGGGMLNLVFGHPIRPEIETLVTVRNSALCEASHKADYAQALIM